MVPAPHAGEMAVWRVVDAAPFQPRRSRRGGWLASGVFCLGLLATGGAAVAVWNVTGPDTIVRTRVLADGAAAISGRAALSEVALRLAGAAGRSATLQDGGETLVISERDRDPAEARRRSASLVDAILNAPVAAVPAPPQPASPDAALRTERARLAAASDSLQARANAVSASLTDLARDIASAGRPEAERKPSRDTLDKGNAALADLQLQRLQLASKYQDTYPAVVALDGQIRTLRVFLMDEAHRVEARPPAAEPTTAVLTAERERLTNELAELGNRRGLVEASLAKLDRRLASLPAAASAPDQKVAAFPPVLITTATTSVTAADERPFTIQVIAAVGLALSLFAAACARLGRRDRHPHSLLLEQVTGARLEGSDRHLALQAEQPAWSPTRFGPGRAYSRS